MSEITLKFHETEFAVVSMDGQSWLTSPQIGGALGYTKGSDSANKLYQGHADEFTDGMTQVVKLMTPGGYQDVRVFSLRGAHLLAMFARTDRAAEFRRWVLDVLDGQSSAVPPAPTFRISDETTYPIHEADKVVASDRAFRAGLRACRAAGMSEAAAYESARTLAKNVTGVDLIGQLKAIDAQRNPPKKPADEGARLFFAAAEAGDIPSVDIDEADGDLVMECYRNWCKENHYQVGSLEWHFKNRWYRRWKERKEIG
jgi:hypothetical protein